MTDEAFRLHRQLHQRGVRLTAVEGRLQFRARRGVLDDVLRAAIHTHRDTLLILSMLEEHAREIDGFWVDGAALPGADFDDAIAAAAADRDVERLQAALRAYHERTYANCQELAPCAHVTEPVLIQWYRENPDSRCARCWLVDQQSVPEKLQDPHGGVPEKSPPTQPELPYLISHIVQRDLSGKVSPVGSRDAFPALASGADAPEVPAHAIPAASTHIDTAPEKETPNDATRTAATGTDREVTNTSTSTENQEEERMKRCDVFKSKYFKAADVDRPLTHDHPGYRTARRTSQSTSAAACPVQ